MTSGCLDRKEVRGAIWGVHSTTDRPAGGNTGRLFLAFGGPVCADRISNCPLDRVLTYKNLIYLLNLQVVTPLPKKTDVDPTFKNFRPVSNLPFLSKMIEKAVSIQLLDHTVIISAKI